MENTADLDDREQLWATASLADLQRTADLAKRMLQAKAAAVLSPGHGEPLVRFISDPDGIGINFRFASDKSGDCVTSHRLSDDAPFASLCVPLRLSRGPDAADVDFGWLCVVDDDSRSWTDEDRTLLSDLAAQLATQVALRHELSGRTKAQQAYADARARLLAVADRIPGLVFERRKVDAGQSAYTFFGSSKTKLPAVRQMMDGGIAGLSFIHRDDREAVRDAILSSNLEETDLDLTFRVKDFDRNIRWIRSQSVVRREPDGSVCWDGLCFDITDLVTAREDAEAARGSKETLLLNVSRELRDPLQAIIALAQLLKAGSPQEPLLSHTRHIEGAAGSMIETVDRLLEEAGGARTDIEKRSASMRGHGAPDSHHALSRTGFRILLADDLDLNRKLIADMLTFEGHVVDCVADGAEALSAVRQQCYDLVLMDMIMPGMDGIAATKAIRALPSAASRVPILALTANAGQEHLDACLEAGMNAALTKPMSMEALAAAVATWTQRRAAA